MIDLLHRLAREGIVRSDLAVVRAHGRCHLTLGLLPDHITGGPDMGDGRLQRAINAHGSCRVYCYARLLQADLLRIGASGGRYQEFFC